MIEKNSSSDDGGPILVLPPFNLWQTIVISVCLAICIITTVGGNILVLLAFIINRKIRKPSNYFITSLAATDMLIGTVSMPFYTIYVLMGYWDLGPLLCDLWLSVDYTVCLVSQYTVLLITIDRFCSVKYPLKYRSWRTENRVIYMITITWIIPALQFLMSIFGREYLTGKPDLISGQCTVQFIKDPVFNTTLIIVNYWMTLVGLFILYGGFYKIVYDIQKRSEARRRKLLPMVALSETGMAGQVVGIGITTDEFAGKKSGKTVGAAANSPDHKEAPPAAENESIPEEMQHASDVGTKTEDNTKREFLIEVVRNKIHDLSSHPKSSKDINVKILENVQGVTSTTTTTLDSPTKPKAIVTSTKKIDCNTDKEPPKPAPSSTSMRGKLMQTDESSPPITGIQTSRISSKQDSIGQNLKGRQKIPFSIWKPKSQPENRARQAFRAISFILGGFVACWTPYHVLALFEGFCSNPPCTNKHLYMFSYFLCYINSPMNLFCYALANQQFKKTFKRILKGDLHMT